MSPARRGKAALSFAQERLYFIEQYEGGSSAYNIPLLFELDPGTDRTVLRRSIKHIVKRHDILRTVFVREESGKVYQVVHSRPPLIEEAHIDPDDLDRNVTEAVNIRFDLHHQYPIKIIFYHTGEKRFLLVTFHHIAFDGWSTDIFLKELNSFYHHYKSGAPLRVPEPDIQYRISLSGREPTFQEKGSTMSLNTGKKPWPAMRPLSSLWINQAGRSQVRGRLLQL